MVGVGGSFSESSAARDQQSQWSGSAGVKGNSQLTQHLLATCSLLGLSLVWSTEFAQAGPYLINLGLSKSLTSLVFLAGPLSGLIVQPIVGSYADQCKLELGRRRPFILAGGAAVVLSLLLFGFPASLASLVTPDNSALRRGLTLSLAITSIWTLDFSINVVQAMDRALLVDVVPHDQQEEVNAWASRLQSVGSIVGYLIGGANLVKPFGWLAGTQIKLITIFSIIAFVASHAITFWSVSERVLVASSAHDENANQTFFTTIKHTLRNIHVTFKQLSQSIRHIFIIQFFAWFGLFSILFFSSTWITEIYLISKGVEELGPGADPQLEDDATRTASMALMAQSVVFFITSVIAPLAIVQQPSDHASHSRYVPQQSWFAQRWPDTWPPFPNITLPQIWAASLAWHSILMAFSWFVSGWRAASVLVALTGVPMAMAFWAPFSLLGELILEEGFAGKSRKRFSTAETEASSPPLPLSPIPEEEDEEAGLLGAPSPTTAKPSDANGQYKDKQPDSPTFSIQTPRPDVLHVRHSEDSLDIDSDRSLQDGPFQVDLEHSQPSRIADSSASDSAGTILVLPQLVVSLVASLIFGVTSHHHQSPKANIPDTAQHASPSIGLELLFLCAECIAQDAKPTDSLLVSAACRQLMLHGWAFVAQSVHRVLFLMDEVLHAHSGSVLATPTFGHTPDANRARCHLHAPGAHKIK